MADGQTREKPIPAIMTEIPSTTFGEAEVYDLIDYLSTKSIDDKGVDDLDSRVLHVGCSVCASCTCGGARMTTPVPNNHVNSMPADDDVLAQLREAASSLDDTTSVAYLQRIIDEDVVRRDRMRTIILELLIRLKAMTDLAAMARRHP